MTDNIKLITKNRIDIVIGIEYVDFYENKYNTEFFIDLHIEHKRAFNGLEEKQYRGKKQHLERFNTIINGIKDKQTNTQSVPVYKYKNEYWVIDGFHRTSTLSYYNLNKNLEIRSYQTPPCIEYYPTNIYYFKNRNYDVKYCNYTMYNFFKNYQKDFHCIILFPNDKSLHKNLLNEIEKNIIYDITIPMNNFKNNFKNNFIQILYYYEGWCKNGGYKVKSDLCFNNGNKLKVYFIEKQGLNILVDLKKKVREYYNKGNDSIHIPDTQEECNSLLDLLNYNTLSFMDKTPSMYINFPNFNKLFEKLKQFCKENNIDTKKICITSSSVLSVYGIRDCGDMDLFIDKKYVDIFKKTPFDNHNKYTIDKHYSKHFEDIIYNPENHFYYQGIKFCNLNIVDDFLDKSNVIHFKYKYNPINLGRSGHLLKDVISLFIFKELIPNSNILYTDFISKQEIIPIQNIKDECVQELDVYDKVLNFNYTSWKGLEYEEVSYIINEIKSCKEKTILVNLNGIVRILLFQIDNWFINNYIQQDIFNERILPTFRDLYYNGVNKNISQERINVFSIHIRRGDIATQTIKIGFDYDYYKNIINIINSILDIPIHIYTEKCNSDDIIPLQNLKNVVCIFGDSNTLIKDFLSMCLSKYILLSNSAFGTTAAYLSKGYVLFENGDSDGFAATLSSKNNNRSIKHFKHDKLQENFIQYNLSNLKEKLISNEIKEYINKFENKNDFDLCNKIDNIINNTNIDIGIVIIWDNNHNNKIIEEITKLENDIELIYSKKIETTLQFTENLLREIHMKKPWWEENLKEQSKKRYNENLTFHIFKGENLHKIFRNIKNTIRNKYQLEKHIFHFSDPDCLPHIGIKCHCESDRKEFLTEVYKHINLLMNKNTLHFLKNSEYNKNFKIHTYFDEYCKFLSKNNLNSDNFIIDNGGVLALYGLRDSHDIDFVTTEKIKCNEKNVDCMNNLHSNEFNKLNLNIETIIKNPEHHFYHYNKKILDIKILKKFKFNRTQHIVDGQSKIRQKDINDYKMICDNFNDIE